MTFDEVNALKWQEVVSDKQANSWQENWFLDGDKARILFAKGGNSGEQERGLELYSGPNTISDDSHAVLWSKKEFTDNVKITFDYTRLDRDDETDISVCILYFLAEGSGAPGFSKDITLWNDKRKVPAMNLYFNNMNLYHISFAAFAANSEPHKYIRARQYRSGDFNNTNIAPDYDPEELFQTGVKYSITAIKYEDMLFFKVDDKICTWKLDRATLLSHGRMGIRQMAGRSGRFSNITISSLS